MQAWHIQNKYFTNYWLKKFHHKQTINGQLEDQDRNLRRWQWHPRLSGPNRLQVALRSIRLHPQAQGLEEDRDRNHQWLHLGKIAANSWVASTWPQTRPPNSARAWRSGSSAAPPTSTCLCSSRLHPKLKRARFVGTIFAQGGFDWMCHHAFGRRLQEDNITIFGLFNIPWICKISSYGESVRDNRPQKDALNHRGARLTQRRRHPAAGGDVRPPHNCSGQLPDGDAHPLEPDHPPRAHLRRLPRVGRQEGLQRVWDTLILRGSRRLQRGHAAAARRRNPAHQEVDFGPLPPLRSQSGGAAEAEDHQTVRRERCGHDQPEDCLQNEQGLRDCEDSREGGAGRSHPQRGWKNILGGHSVWTLYSEGLGRDARHRHTCDGQDDWVAPEIYGQRVHQERQA